MAIMSVIKVALICNITAIVIGSLFDIVFGDPKTKLHPVRLIGALIARLEKILYDDNSPFIRGVILLLVVIFIVGGVYVALVYLVASIAALLFNSKIAILTGYILISSIGVYISISIRNMIEHIIPISNAIDKHDLDAARQALSMVVSRDTINMPEEKIISSAIETISENFTDTVLTPLFIGVFLGGFGALLYKAVNTLDSMVGYKNDRYKEFGTASAVADDILNYIPARLSIVPITISAIYLSIFHGNRFYPSGAIVTYKYYRKLHHSPNSAHSISAFAGALQVRLGGDTMYDSEIVHNPIINGGTKQLNNMKLADAWTLYKTSALCAILLLLISVLLFIYI